MSKTIKPGTTVSHCNFTRTVHVDEGIAEALILQARANAWMSDALVRIASQLLHEDTMPLISVVDSEEPNRGAKA